jgi:hypothetical protein
MRLALGLRMPLSQVIALPAWELEAWAAWELVFGTIGPQREDWRIAHQTACLLQHELAALYAKAGIEPQTAKVNPHDYMALVPWDGLTTAQRVHRKAEAAAKAAASNDAAVMAELRSGPIMARIRQLREQGRIAELQASMDAEGNWIGPLADPVLADPAQAPPSNGPVTAT